MFTHLHTRSHFSFQAGASSPEDLVRRAAEFGYRHLALTDRDGLYGAVRFQQACQEHGLVPIFGAEVQVGSGYLVLLAASNEGYANLCRLLTRAHGAAEGIRPETPRLSVEHLTSFAGDLFCLTGTRQSHLGRLLSAEHTVEARRHLRTLRTIYGERLSVELSHHMLEGEAQRLRRLRELADRCGVPICATGEVWYATPREYRLYDLLTCARHGITVFESHPDRPQNAEADLKAEDVLRRLIPYPEAFERAAEIAARCRVDLLPGHIIPPAARLPEGRTAREVLRVRCREGLRRRYHESPLREKARRQLEHELEVIGELELEEFFLVVAEVCGEARRRGIRCAGRGSAANALVAYLLEITHVCPLEQGLLFERFLHRGRRGTPDIDVDFDSERREEIIRWIEERFGLRQTAMTATLITYRLRSALRDVAKALGFDLQQVDRMTKAVPRRSARHVHDYRETIERSVGGRSPLTDVLVEMVGALEDVPRHLGLHSGGMILSRRPLYTVTPVQVSANGVRMIQFDKDDAEALGLVKLDVLGLRMLATLSEAEELARRHGARDLDLEALPPDDIPTYNMIRASETIGCFQIESHGQMHLLAQHQPECFGDLITEVALFRPGPLQSGMVHPFIRRRRGLEPVRYDHPLLRPILHDTYGVILFQEQILEIAHRFAGMPLEEADRFRQLMSKYRSESAMESMRGRFVEGATGNGIEEATAQHVFDQISNFVGYGFCRSHAAAFAHTVYQSAYMKRHHPAAFMAAVMQHRPGMYNLTTLEEEARRFGVETLLPEINRSGLRYDLERRGDELAIRKPLTSVRGLAPDDARRILWERLREGDFESTEDLYRRVRLPQDVFEHLARSGALDRIAGSSRGALWEVGLLERRLGRPGQRQEPTLFDLPAVTEGDLPELPALAAEERLRWDYETHGSARHHPVRLVRRELTELEIRPIALAAQLGGRHWHRRNKPLQLTTAGIVTLRQQPPTANGVQFITLEDETGYLQCVARPEVRGALGHVLGQSALIVRGPLHVDGNWRGLVIQQAWVLDGLLGGYEGFPSADGGRDRLILKSTETSP